MVYISSDGTVTKKQPFSLSLIFGWFWGILNFFYMFAWTLFNPGTDRRDGRYSVDFRPPGSGSSSRRYGGSGPSNGPNSPPPPSGCGCGG